MPSIHVAGRAQPVPGSPVRSVLVSLQREGVFIETACGGRAMCGRCAVRVVSGAELLSRVGPREAERLGLMSAPLDVRLACQAFAHGDVTIEVLNPQPPRRGGDDLPDPATPGAP